MLATSSDWELDVQRGPDWLIVTMQSMPAGKETAPLAERLWALMQQNLTHRLVLELDKVPVLNSSFIEQLIQLSRMICEHDGVLRICGLSVYNRRLLHSRHLDECFKPYNDRHEAVMGCHSRPSQPR